MSNGSGRVDQTQKGVSHTHERHRQDGTVDQVSHGKAPPHKPGDHFAEDPASGKLVRLPADHARDPELQLGRVIRSLKDRAGVAEKTPKSEAAARGTRIAEKLAVQPDKIRGELQRADPKGKPLTPFET